MINENEVCAVFRRRLCSVGHGCGREKGGAGLVRAETGRNDQSEDGGRSERRGVPVQRTQRPAGRSGERFAENELPPSDGFR